MRLLAAIVVLALALAGCGLKGPLYLPGQSPKKPTWPAPSTAPAPAPAPAETPARTPDTPASSDSSK